METPKEKNLQNEESAEHLENAKHFQDAPPEFYEEIKEKENIITNIINNSKVYSFRKNNIDQILKNNFSDKEILEILQKELDDAKEQKIFYKQKKILTFLACLSTSEKHGNFYVRKLNDKYFDLLERFSNQKEVSYFLNIFVEKLKKEAEEKIENYFELTPTYDYFEISPGIFAYVDGSKIYVSEKEDEQKVRKALIDMETFKNYENTKSLSEKFKRIISKPETIINSNWIEKYVATDYKIFQTLITKELVVNPQSQEFVNDYSSLMDPKMSKIIEKDLNIELKKISIHEQFYFLNFIKNTNLKDIELVKNFTSKFNLSGFKTFLSIAHGGPEMGNKILTVAENLSQKQAQGVFDSYSRIIDSANNFTQKIGEKLDKEVSGQLLDALLTKAKDILLSAEFISSPENETPYQIEDLQNALEGIELQLEILNDLGEKKKFEYKSISENNQTKRLLVRDDKNDFEYDLRILSRPHAEQTAQARVSVELGFDTQKPNEKLQQAFNQTIVYKESNKTISKSSLRFSVDRETNGETPHLSLDFGSSSFDGETISRTGDVFGNSIALVSEYGSHTPVFDPRFADEETFARMVEGIQQEIKKI